MMHLTKFLKLRRTSIALTSKTVSRTFSSEEKIDVPKRIQRGPTDILRALASTVERDPTAAHYKYHDDPFLIPLSSSGKRVFAMAQESGRKAAHWVRAQHPDLFQHKEADPVIESFIPPMVYTENSKVEITDLEKLISTGQTSDAVTVYNLLKAENVEVKSELEQAMLELLCYYNGEDGASNEFIEERWFKQASKGKEKIRKTWKDGDLAEQIFNNLETKTDKAYCAIIQGMAKYYQIDKAVQIYQEAQNNKIALNTETYNSLISTVNAVKESFDLRWSLLTEYLRQMKSNKLTPNLGTLNAILHSLNFMGNLGFGKKYSLQTLSEFKKLGIEPCLTSWYYILSIFCRERGPTSPILHSIMDLLENKNIEIKDLRDVNFFVTAMEVCRHHLNNVALANRVNNLLHFGENYNLIGDSFRESVYYRHYFALLCSNLPLEDFMNEVYNKLVPHIYIPELGIMAEVLNQVDANGAVEYIPKLWSDLVVFDQSHRENLVDSILNTMVNNKELLTPELNEKFAKIAWDIYNRYGKEEEGVSLKLKLTGDLLGKLLLLLIRDKDFNKACTIMDNLDKNQQSIAGIPKFETLSSFVDLCIEEKAPSRAISCIQYSLDCGYPETKSLAVKLHQKLNLDEVFLGRITAIVGDLNLP